MRRLYLHIGLGKTGSSALQSWLSINAEELARQGITYADLSADARRGRPSSGNGGPLLQAIRDTDFAAVERLLRETYFPRAGGERAIISSELLKDVRPPKLEQLRAVLARLGIEAHIIAYIRSVYERAYSAYGQGVKTDGSTEPFGEADVARTMLTTLAWLRKYHEHFGAAMTVLNYDDPDSDIYQSFAGVAEIELANMRAVERRVNRSLSHAELEVQRRLNALHGGLFSAPIAQHLLRAAPDKATATHYDADLLERTREVCAESIEWINQRFHPTPPLVCDRFDSRAGRPAQENPGALLADIARWALDFEPGADSAQAYARFLPQLADLLDRNCGSLRTDLLARAAAMRARGGS